jgi:GNAT superfamily N-acetyltransferase
MPEPSRLTHPTTVWYLAMDDREALRPSGRAAGGAEARRAEVPFGALNRFFYLEVGRDFHWVDRLGWTAGRWQVWAERVETWLLHDRGTPAGYAEIDARADGTVDLAFFGLLEPFRGRGLGGMLLTRAVERAWELAAPAQGRVMVTTCELDGPHALANYRARGFDLVREAVEPRRRMV